jgi:hypothetical protein
MNSKGIELSLNFIVIIIISLMVFFFGAKFIYQLGHEATKLQSMTVDELDREIGNLVCQGMERVCYGFDTKQIKRGTLGIFGVRIRNVLDGVEEFEVVVSRPDVPGYTKSGEEILQDELEWKPKERYASIQKNEEATVAIGVEVPKSGVVSGTYIFDVAVCYDDGDSTNDGETDPLDRCENRDLYSYNKLYVEVP